MIWRGRRRRLGRLHRLYPYYEYAGLWCARIAIPPLGYPNDKSVKTSASGSEG